MPACVLGLPGLRPGLLPRGGPDDVDLVAGVNAGPGRLETATGRSKSQVLRAALRSYIPNQQ